jgi:FHS family L-fucose permease-like MFS transporter
LAIPYVTIGFVVLILALIFTRIKMPEINESDAEHAELSNIDSSTISVAHTSLFHYKHFKWSVASQFFYVAAQTGINSFFINYVFDVFKTMETQQVVGHGFLVWLLQLINGTDVINEGMYDASAGLILAFGGMGLFTIGRFAGSALLGKFKPNKLLAFYAMACIILTGLVIMGLGAISIVALCLIYFFMSIMFPVNFALGLRDLGSHTKRASSFLVMAIVGGAIFPALMGYVADKSSMQIGFVIPLVCFIVVFLFGTTGYKIKKA